MSPFTLSLVVTLVIFLIVITGGALLAALATLVSHFFIRNAPSAEVMADFIAGEATRLGNNRIKTKMANVQPGQPEEEDDATSDEIAGSAGAFDIIGKYSRYIALMAAWVATCGSLFMSEVMGWVPCLLCWYQRILMYPLSLILAVGILRRDKGLHKYALALSIPGACVSLYHYLYQKTDLFRGMVPCTVGVPCSADYLNWFGGVVTIPFLALIAFLIITFCMVASRLGSSVDEGESEEEQSTAQPRRRLAIALPVFIIIAVIIGGFLIAANVVRNSAPASAAPEGSPVAQVLPTPDSTALARGKVLYEESCAACHGLNGAGTQAGMPLTNSKLVQTGSDAEILKFVRMGRTAQDSHNTTGLAMPANGGQSNASDQDLAAVVAYVRQLANGAH